jgi:hypothetical protein
MTGLLTVGANRVGTLPRWGAAMLRPYRVSHNGLGLRVGLDLSSQIVLATVMIFTRPRTLFLASLCKLYKRNFG